MNGIILDLILFAFLILFSIIGFYKGFLRGLLSLFGFIGSAIIAFLTRNFFANLLNKAFGWGTVFADFIMKQVGNLNQAFVVEQFGDSTSMLNAVNSSDINVIYKKIFERFILQADFTGGALTIGDIVSSAISSLILKVIAVILVFVVFRILVVILNLVLKKLPKKNIFGAFDRTLGILVGGLKGLIVISVLLILFNVVCMIPSVSEKVFPIIESSYVTKPLLDFINTFILKF